MAGFNGAKVAVLAEGADRAQLNVVRSRLESAGASVAEVPADVPFDTAHPSGFAGLVVLDLSPLEAQRPGGKAAQVVREFMLADKPVAAIGGGIKLLVAADAVAGRSIAAMAEVHGDVLGAGGEIADTSIHVDEKLVTARSGQDIHLFLERVVRTFAGQLEERQIDQVSEQSFPASDPPPGPGAIGAARGAGRDAFDDSSADAPA
jgi:putative intracellular protease/amidase